MIISTYEELQKVLEKIKDSGLKLVVLNSKPGLGKTTIVKRVFPQALILNNKTTPLGLYEKIYYHRKKVVIIDDVNGLLNNKAINSFLKQATDGEGLITYTTSQTLAVPDKFIFEGLIIITTNDFNADSVNNQALADRGLIITFKPSKKELINKAKSIINDDEIVNYLRLFSLDGLSLRTFLKAKEYKSIGLDWKSLIRSEVKENEKVKEFKELLRKYPDYPDKIRLLFWNYGRATYYRIKKKVVKEP